MDSCGLDIQVEPYIDKIKMPDNLRIGLLVAKQHEKCNTEGCTFDYYGLGFGQSPFPIPKPISNSLAANADKAHYSDSEGIMTIVVYLTVVVFTTPALEPIAAINAAFQLTQL